jgi:hypothetical protein
MHPWLFRWDDGTGALTPERDSERDIERDSERLLDDATVDMLECTMAGLRQSCY